MASFEINSIHLSRNDRPPCGCRTAGGAALNISDFPDSNLAAYAHGREGTARRCQPAQRPGREVVFCGPDAAPGHNTAAVTQHGCCHTAWLLSQGTDAGVPPCQAATHLTAGTEKKAKAPHCPSIMQRSVKGTLKVSVAEAAHLSSEVYFSKKKVTGVHEQTVGDRWMK